jgi:glycosyltransferase involved in cell wall biosynthesis
MRGYREKKMRVALVGDYPLNPSKIVGGPQSVFSYLIEGLKSQEDLDLHVVTFSRGLGSSRTCRRRDVTFHYIAFPRLPTEIAVPFLRHRIHSALDRIRPDIVHSQAALYGAICSQAGYPLLTTLHNIPGSESRFAVNLVNRIRLSLHNKWIRHLLFHRVRHIISINQYIRLGIATHTNARIYSVDNPVHSAFFALSRTKPTRGRLLFVGLLRKIKRPDLALHAFQIARRQLPFLTLTMAGGFYDKALVRDLQKMLVRRRLTDSVRLVDHLPEDALLQQYRESSTLLLTSDLETSPMAIHQAMAAGRGVVATKVGGVPYIVDHGKTGLLAEPGDAAGLADAILRLERDEDLHSRVCLEARRVAEDRFHCFRVAERMHKVYASVLDGSPYTEAVESYQPAIES